jgi:hypothetical protein
MDSLFERLGLWLAGAYAAYGVVFLLIPTLTFAYVGLLGGVIVTVVARARGRDPWRSAFPWLRRATRFGLEIVFGLINPLLYLVVFAAALPAMRREAEQSWWMAPLLTTAWLLLAAFWTMRLFGGAIDRGRRSTRVVMASLLALASICVLTFAIKDLRLLDATIATERSGPGVFGVVVRLAPLYLIPLALLLDYLRATLDTTDSLQHTGLFLLRGRTAGLVAAGLATIAGLMVAAGLYRSSDGAVRDVVRNQRHAITAAAALYDVDPKLVAAIVYVTHRDQLSPFRDGLERMAVGMWTLGYWPAIGANETLLNRPLDVSIGLAQIKPRTAQTATLLAAGRAFGETSLAHASAYRDGEPAGEAWRVLPVSNTEPALPIGVPASRQEVVRTLLQAQGNLETCALILSLYQRQWEAANAAWSLRQRPEILATLYQIGFARSKPHAAPRANAFGARVRAVHDEPWLRELFMAGSTPDKPARDQMARRD